MNDAPAFANPSIISGFLFHRINEHNSLKLVATYRHVLWGHMYKLLVRFRVEYLAISTSQRVKTNVISRIMPRAFLLYWVTTYPVTLFNVNSISIS